MRKIDEISPGLGLVMISRSKVTLQQRLVNLEMETLNQLEIALEELEIDGLFE